MRKFAQFGPPAGAAPPGGIPPIPPMPGAAPMASPALPTTPPADPPRQEIGSPLDSLAKVLYDANITDLIQQAAGTGTEQLALKVWQDYGGDEKGGVVNGRVGARQPNQKNVTPQAEEQEQEATEDSKWKRLPAGKSIADITTLDEISSLMDGLILGLVKNNAKQQGGAPGGPGGPPPGGEGPPPGPTASRNKWTKVASNFDKQGLFEQADFIDFVVKQSLRKI